MTTGDFAVTDNPKEDDFYKRADARLAAEKAIPTDDEVLLREAKDASEAWLIGMRRHEEACDIAFSKEEKWWQVLLFKPPFYIPPVPPPIPTRLKIIAERMGWLPKPCKPVFPENKYERRPEA